MTSRWRVKRFRLHLRSREITVSFRRFRTRKENRSTRFKQLVLRIRILSVRELAIAIRHKKQKPKRTYSRLLTAPRYIFSPSTAMLVGLVGIAYFGLNIQAPVVHRVVNDNKAHAATIPESTKPKPPKTMPRSQPTRISIPSIGVDSPVIAVGLLPNDTISVPVQFDTVGWYSNGPSPGELGPSVLVGHVDSQDGPAVFWRLTELRKGDKIIIHRQDGSRLLFSVTDLKQYSQLKFPTQQVYGNIEHAGIRIITCGGVFDKNVGRYTDNTVAYGTLTH